MITLTCSSCGKTFYATETLEITINHNLITPDEIKCDECQEDPDEGSSLILFP